MSKYVFNHIALYDDENNCWMVYEKLNKKIPKTVAHYGSRVLGKGDTANQAIKDAVSNGVKPYDVQVVE